VKVGNARKFVKLWARSNLHRERHRPVPLAADVKIKPYLAQHDRSRMASSTPIPIGRISEICGSVCAGFADYGLELTRVFVTTIASQGDPLYEKFKELHCAGTRSDRSEIAKNRHHRPENEAQRTVIQAQGVAEKRQIEAILPAGARVRRAEKVAQNVGAGNFPAPASAWACWRRAVGMAAASPEWQGPLKPAVEAQAPDSGLAGFRKGGKAADHEKTAVCVRREFERRSSSASRNIGRKSYERHRKGVFRRTGVLLPDCKPRRVHAALPEPGDSGRVRLQHGRAGGFHPRRKLEF
jgi:hypothetical protein